MFRGSERGGGGGSSRRVETRRREQTRCTRYPPSFLLCCVLIQTTNSWIHSKISRKKKNKEKNDFLVEDPKSGTWTPGIRCLSLKGGFGQGVSSLFLLKGMARCVAPQKHATGHAI